MWRRLRILALLVILLFVALNAYFDRVYTTDWNIPLRVAIYPINGDGSDEAERFVRAPGADAFRPLEAFFEQEARHYGLEMERPVRLSLASQLRELPPMLDAEPNVLRVALWSLRMRYWAWRVPEAPGPSPDIKLFVLFHDPERSPSVPHSLGLQKGLFGIVHVFADRTMLGSNDVVLAHELLHTLGATDKYHAASNQPLHPHGYAEPERDPLYPQSHAELMGGRIPRSPSDSVTPESLASVLVGPVTAAEIGWRTQ